MYLDRLIVKRGSAEVRNLPFKRGLNLILDRPTSALTQSGNDVGKTTVLRLIDFALGSNGDDIWQDPEFKDVINQEVYDYLHGTTPVAVELHLSSIHGQAHVLHRKFNVKKGDAGAWRVDNTECQKLDAYRSAVRNLLFGSAASKPTLRQLVPKFVRSSPKLMSLTLKFLDNYASEATYEGIHLYLFGFFAVDVLEARPRLAEQAKRLKRDEEALTRNRDVGEIEQLLLHLGREIEDMTKSAELRGEVPEIAAQADRVADLRGRASALSSELAQAEGEISALQLTISDFEKEYADIDRGTIEAVYKDAQRYLPKLQHDWNELVDFIHGLRGRKQQFLELRIATLEARAVELRQQLDGLQASERTVISTLVSLPAFNNALELRADLRDKIKRVGSLEQTLADIQNVRSQRVTVENQLEETRKRIDSARADLVASIGIFNKYFSKLSKSLYGEEYLLHNKDSKQGKVTFSLSSVGANVGAGKKASQTAAFDLAYIAFLEERGIPFPRFVCHDGMESTHDNPLSALLTEAAASSGQLILSTLRDKLPKMPDEFIATNTVLELSQDDRFFRI